MQFGNFSPNDVQISHKFLLFWFFSFLSVSFYGISKQKRAPGSCRRRISLRLVRWNPSPLAYFPPLSLRLNREYLRFCTTSADFRFVAHVCSFISRRFVRSSRMAIGFFFCWDRHYWIRWRLCCPVDCCWFDYKFVLCIGSIWDDYVLDYFLPLSVLVTVIMTSKRRSNPCSPLIESIIIFLKQCQVEVDPAGIQPAQLSRLFLFLFFHLIILMAFSTIPSDLGWVHLDCDPLNRSRKSPIIVIYALNRMLERLAKMGEETG